MSITNLKRSSDKADVVDLTKEDDNVVNLVDEESNGEEIAAIARRKLRKSEKQRRQLQEFQEYLEDLPAEDRRSVNEAFGRVSEEKRELLRRREEFKASNRPGPQTDKIKSQLDSTLLALVGMEDKIRRGDTLPTEAKSYGIRASKIGDGVRRLIHEFSTADAVARIAQDIHYSEREMLQNDTWFNEGQRNSMITPTAISTGSRYRPLYISENANQEVIRGALENSSRPGLLPDGSYIPSEMVQRYRSNDQDRSRQSGLAAATQIYQQTEYMHQAKPAMDARAFEALVDQALNEAEPLDFPPQMSCATLEHQRQGLGWLIRAERGTNKGGILADDMGLGKTVQTIALFYANPPPAILDASTSKPPTSDLPSSPCSASSSARLDLNPSPTPKLNDYRLILVVCPVALIRTWEDELKARVRPESRMRVYVHHSINKKRLKSPRRIQEVADIVICSYHALVTEYKELEAFRATRVRLETNGEHLKASRLRLDIQKTPLLSIKWHRVVLDEAHIIKNKLSQMSLAATELKARYRLVLTGTPMQNRLEELYPLVRFLHIEPHCNWTQFQQLLPKNDNFKQFEAQKNLAAFLSAVLLRRRKDTKINGRKIIDNLPPKHVVRQITTMKEVERKSYDILEQKIKDEFAKSQKKQQSLSRIEETLQWSNMLVYLLRLRQTSCHPLLVQITKRSQQRAHWGNNDETKECCKIALRVNPEKRRELLQIPDNDRVCYQCSGPASALVDTNMLINCGHIACSECSPTLMDTEEGGLCLCGTRSRQLANLEILSIIEKDEPESVSECVESLLRYQMPRLDSDRRQANQRRRKLNELQEDARQRMALENWADDEIDPFSLSDPEDMDLERRSRCSPITSEEKSLHLSDDLFVNLEEFPQQNIQVEDQKIDEVSELEIIEEDESCTTQDTLTKAPHEKLKKDPLAHKIDIDDVARNFKIANIFERGWISSAKIESCLQILRDIWTTSPDDKVIIFSSFTSLIDVLAIPLTAAMIPYEEYTGRMSVSDRNDVLEEFKMGRTKVLLTSLKAGNVGLTLTQANRVILVEPFWNPYIEDQAQDRVYRIGQSREVTVYRLFVANTVEDRISALQDKKRELIESALENGGKTKSQNLSRADIMYALGLR